MKKPANQATRLVGHKGEIYTLQFSPDGEYLASAGHDRLIYFWEVFPSDETPKNVGVLKGHKNAILDLKFSADSERLYTAGSDWQLIGWDTRGFQRTRKFKGHKGIVNSVGILEGEDRILVSGSDDMSVRVWDERDKHAAATYELDY